MMGAVVGGPARALFRRGDRVLPGEGDGRIERQRVSCVCHRSPSRLYTPAALRRRQLSSMTASSSAQTPGKKDALAGREDAYNGFLIDPEGLPSSPEALLASLRASEAVWRERAYRGIWLRLPKRLAGSTGAAVEAGFEFHHAEKEYLMLTRWMVEGQPDALPPNASHQVGIGACVVNEHGKILAVRELYGPLRGTGVWKLPTGLVHVGEDITETAEREVLEETGVRARCVGLAWDGVEELGFSQITNVRSPLARFAPVCTLCLLPFTPAGLQACWE